MTSVNFSVSTCENVHVPDRATNMADNTGRQSVGLISAQQLRGVKDEDLLKDILPDPSTFGHANNKIE
eukprot:1801967-Rhodomonas_salina.2